MRQAKGRKDRYVMLSSVAVRAVAEGDLARIQSPLDDLMGGEERGDLPHDSTEAGEGR